MHTRRGTYPWTGLAILSLVAVLVALGANPTLARYEGTEPIEIPDKGNNGIFALDGQYVHNVGELQLNITNWGLIGSRPSTQAPYSDAPSAMWPAGSGVDYLWAAGAWVGAMKNGVPLVSTGQFTPEFLANPDDPLDDVYETAQGAPGGARYPSPSFDDDASVEAVIPPRVNEDPLNGVDDDGDGAIDEDFAAIGNQMFRCVMRDNTALSQELFSEHDPLDIQLVQESFQWEGETVDDFVGFEFTVTNIGVNPLEDVFLGFFADCDIGARSGSGIAEDDLTWFTKTDVRALDNSNVRVQIAAMYDADGDGGLAEAFFGIMFLGHPTDPTGESAPEFVGIRSFQSFGGNQPFDKGGDPTNDAERYELLSREELDSPPALFDDGKANDFRILLAQGPFTPLDPGQSLTFQAAMVAGPGPDGMLRNAAEAALTYYGAYFNRDGDPNTGIKGRESYLCEDEFPVVQGTNLLFTLFQDCSDSLSLLSDTPPSPISSEDLDGDGCIWRNSDCPFESERGAELSGEPRETPCLQDGIAADPSILAGCTGIEGKEFGVPWLVGLAPEAPALRLWQTDGRVHVFWDNISEIVPDVRLQRVDFESYRVWRADNWDRPFGSSIENGPESRLWRLIAEYDVVNFFEDRRTVNGEEIIRELPLGSNTGLDIINYTPMQLRPGHPRNTEFQELDDLIQRIVDADPSLVPTRKPSTFLRYIIEGEVTPLGMDYPELQDWDCCPAEIDTAYYSKVGLEWYEYIDQDVHNGIFYFYSVTASDFNADPSDPDRLIPIGPGLVGDPQSNFDFAIPVPEAQTAADRDARGHNIYVVPNPATRSALAEFSQLNPNSDDPTGIRVMFSNLPRARNTIKIYTLAGDLVETLNHDGTGGSGAEFWNLVSRNGQEVVSGIYLYSVESDDSAFDRVVGRFVIVR